MCTPCGCLGCGSQTDRDLHNPNARRPLPHDTIIVMPDPTILLAPPPMSQMDSNAVSRMSINPFTRRPMGVKTKASKSGPKLDPRPMPSLVKHLPYMMEKPLRPIPDCPPGLEHLVQADQFYVQHCRSMHIIPAIHDYESRDRYQILNKDGKRIYYAIGESPEFWRWGLSGARPFYIKVMDHHGNIVLTMKRPWTFGLCWFGGECTGNKIEVRYSAGNVLGYIKQRFTCISPLYDVEDVNENPLLYAQGPPIACCPFFCLRYYGKFTLYDHTPGNINAGKFVEFPFGIGQENVSNAISLTFPKNLEVENKAVLLGLLFLVYFMYFEVTDSISGLNSKRRNTVVSNRVSDWTNPNRVPFKRLQAGDVPGKCYPCKIIFIFSLILLFTFAILWVTNDYPFGSIYTADAINEDADKSALSLFFSSF